MGHTEKHHIVHWMRGGPTDTCNLLCLCPGHHDAHHRGEFTITGNADLPDDHPDAVRFRSTNDGKPITYRHPPPRHRAEPLPAGKPYTGPTGERMYARNVEFVRRSQPANLVGGRA
ncbi:HNH endonuclease signature motif containing protein [Kineosphaera limosa]|uniref:HNH endonuclease signature motif containing protein n=1 Tax=Kineosphaera limosa TaxID=111564 RepID=UPI003B838777